MRREYGSRLMGLVDAPLTPGTLTEIYAAAAEALGRWEPRLELTRVQARPAASSPAGGQVVIDLEGVYLPDGPFSSQPVRLEGLEI